MFIICSPFGSVFPGVELNFNPPPRQRSSYDCCMNADAPNAVATFDGIRSAAAKTITTSKNVSAGDRNLISRPPSWIAKLRRLNASN
jgi:hypothetical protein